MAEDNNIMAVIFDMDGVIVDHHEGNIEPAESLELLTKTLINNEN